MRLRLNLPRIDWEKLADDRKLKIMIGLSVVLIVFVIFLFDIFISIYRCRSLSADYTIEEESIYEEEIFEPAKAPTKEAKHPRFVLKKKVMVAIILDDAGSGSPNYNEIFSIKQPMTISIIPNLPNSFNVAKQAKRSGFQVMMHLPMEAKNVRFARDYGGIVNCSLSEEDIKKIVLEDFDSVKLADGINNHMGSKATEDERVMKAVLSSIGRGKYFIDSKTSKDSVAYKTAKELGIPSAENNIFLDGSADETQIENKFRALIAMAKIRGYAIGIGHATRGVTISVLKRLMPIYSKNGVKFVHASELVK